MNIQYPAGIWVVLMALPVLTLLLDQRDFGDLSLTLLLGTSKMERFFGFFGKIDDVNPPSRGIH